MEENLVVYQSFDFRNGLSCGKASGSTVFRGVLVLYREDYSES
jgi:hypothetical protein